MAELTHGQRTSGRRGSEPPLYRVWRQLKQRCNNPNNPHYKYYGGRGIKISHRWDDYLTFARDMGLHPGKGWSIERVNVDGHYEPGNCGWAKQKTQVRNRRCTKLTQHIADQIRAEYKRGVNTHATLAQKYNVSPTNIWAVVNNKIWVP